MKQLNIILISLILILNNVLLAEERTEERTDVLRDLSKTDFQNLTGSQISELPYAEYFNKLPRNITLTLSEDKDLSKYEGRHIYVGYGLYDRTNDEYCKYLPISVLYQEGQTVPLLESNFYNFKKKGEHSYAMSKDSMTYEECLSLTNKYGGYPVVIENSSENVFVTNMAQVPEQSTTTQDVLTEFTADEMAEYVAGLKGDPSESYQLIHLDPNDGSTIIKQFSLNVNSNQSSIQGIWLGMHKQDNNCENDFTYQSEFPSDYENWSYQEPNCNSSNHEIAVMLDPVGINVNGKTLDKGKWKDVKKTEKYHCLMETDSPDIHKPYKICAPWWRVDREYDNTATLTEKMGFDFRDYDHSTIPKRMRVCSKYDVDFIPQEEQAFRTVSCRSYYSMKKYEECINDPEREVCKVNECKGYIQDTCNLKNTVEIEEPMKNYVKEIMVIDGVAKEVKVKRNIITYIYECPPSVPSQKKCLEFSEFLIFPAKCSNGATIYGTKLKYFGMDGHPLGNGVAGELDVANSFTGDCPENYTNTANTN